MPCRCPTGSHQVKLYSVGERPPAERPATVRFGFHLPPALALRVEPGRQQPCIHGVRLDVRGDGLVTIGGYDAMESYALAQVMEQARRFLDQVARDDSAARRLQLAPTSVPAAVVCASRDERPALYRIIFGARAAIAPTERHHGEPILI